MRSFIAILLCCVLTTLGQPEFTADFTMTSTAMATGQVTGKVYYSWLNAAIKFVYTTQNFVETQLYNLDHSETSFANQKGFNVGSCGCELASVPGPQPRFVIDSNSNFIIDSAPDASGCTRYQRVGGAYTIWLDSSKKACKMLINDGTARTFTFTNVVARTYTRLTDFPTPPGCICRTPLDITIVLDRSGSVDINEWVSEKGFTKDFALSFEYATTSADSALKTNLALVNFNTAASTAWRLSQGNTLNNVNTSLNALKCCANAGQSCCQGYTSISSGIRQGALELAASTRPASAKVLLLVTDGFHNTIYNNPDNQCYGCGSIADGTQQMLDCVLSSGQSAGRTRCLNDLQAASDYAYSSVPKLLVFTVAVGPIFSTPLKEFDIITKNDRTHQFSATDFSQLSTILSSVTQTVCGNTKSACDGCCGFCACGVCRAPDSCLDGPCLIGSLQGTCCKQNPKTCPNLDPCKISSCRPSDSACILSDKPCPAENVCEKYTCVGGSCVTTFKGVNQDKCHTAQCVKPNPNDPTTWSIQQNPICTPGNDPCVNYGCVEGVCTATPRTPPNLCQYCDATGQFVDKTCTAKSCNTVKCNLATGNCDYTPLDCISDDSDKCDLSECDISQNKCITKFQTCSNSSNRCIYTTGCVKSTGLCDSITVTCSASPDCRDNICNTTTGVCNLVRNEARCGGICANQNCAAGSTSCYTLYCDPTKTIANCDINTTTGGRCATEIMADKCKQNGRCDNLEGCKYDVITCAQPADKCQYTIANSSFGGCCQTFNKSCGNDPCFTYKCDSATGNCTSTPICPTSNACVSWRCENGRCLNTTTTCVAPNKCTKALPCDVTKGCLFEPIICDDKNACTLDSCLLTTGLCSFVNVSCDDKNWCTLDSCNINGSCVFTDRICNDNDACTIDSCNKTLEKCVFNPIDVPKVCDDSNACTIDTCNATKGCVHANITCRDADNCTIDQCDPYYGCLYNPIVCTTILPCALAQCGNQSGNCTIEILYCEVSNTELIVATTVSGGILAAIIVGAILAAAFLGGGGAAMYNQVANTNTQPAITNNPLYNQPTQPNNPLYQPA